MLVAVVPPRPSEALSDALRLAGVDFEPLPDSPAPGDWAAVVIELGESPAALLRQARRLSEDLGLPSLMVVAKEDAALLNEATFTGDFLLRPPDPVELRVRLERMTAAGGDSEVVAFKDLELNTATYQASAGGRPVGLTYMEYELLRFFIENQGRVWSREQLLSKVWGYEYYGGARTVDVHVRRLRAKLGEERASWITTVRSVGYRFG